MLSSLPIGLQLSAKRNGKEVDVRHRCEDGKLLFRNPSAEFCYFTAEQQIQKLDPTYVGSGLDHIFVLFGKYKYKSLEELKDLSVEEQRFVGSEVACAPIPALPTPCALPRAAHRNVDGYREREGTPFYKCLPPVLQLYVHEQGHEPLFVELSTWYPIGYTDTKTGRTWENPFHLLASYRKRVGCTHYTRPLERIYLLKGQYKGHSLSSLFQTLTEEEMKSMDKHYYPRKLERISWLPNGLELYVKVPDRPVLEGVLLAHCGEDTLFKNPSDIAFGDVPYYRTAMELVDKWRGAPSPLHEQGLNSIYVAKGAYKDKSLGSLLMTKTQIELRAAFRNEVKANTVVMPVASPVPAPADPLAKLAAKEAVMQLEKQLLDQLQEQIQRIKAYPSDLEAQIAAAKAELAFLATVEMRIQELRLLEATLVEKRKILEAVELA